MRTTILFLLFFATLSSYSQIVNIENKRLGKKEGFSGSIDLNLNFIMNTRRLLQIGDRLKVAYTKKKSHLMLLTDHSFVKSEGEDFVNRGYYHLRYNLTLKDSGRVDWEVYQQGQFNRIQKINLRMIGGTGFRLALLNHKKFDLNLGTGFMAEYEELIDIGLSRNILSSSYLSFDGQFTEGFGLNTITYFQPKMTDWGNYRFANETHLRFKINKYLTFLVIYSLAHDSRELEGVRKTNYVLKNTLSFRF